MTHLHVGEICERRIATAPATMTALAAAKADAPARALVFMVVPKGAPLTSPA